MSYYADRIYLHAKIYALHNTLFKKRDYVELINAKKIHLAFPNYMPGSDETAYEANYIQLKEILFRQQIEKVLVLIQANKFYHDLFIAFLRLFELRNVKALAARAYNRPPHIQQWYNITPHNLFSREILEKDISPIDLKELLNGTYLHEAVQFDEPPAYEIIESTIDFLGVRHLFNFSKKLFSRSRNDFIDITARKIGTTRVLWHHRLKNYYNWNEERAAGYFEELDSLFNQPRGARKYAERAIKEITGTLENEFGQLLARKNHDLSLVEDFLENDFFEYISKRFFTDFDSINPVLSYLWLLYFQVRNIFRIVEGLRFSVPGSILSNKIICRD
ncbi:MAG: V-type ATPase subunit [bacterium]|nr:V-type ATPase subunit [bacterium]